MRRVLVVITVIAAGLVVWAAPAGAVNLTGGCQGQGVSVDKDGKQIMTATAPGAEPGTSGNPVLVDYDGKVQYSGTGPLILNHHWHVKVFGITVKSGGSPNGSHETSTSGTAIVKDYLPFKITGVYYVSGGIAGDGGACDGNAYVKLIGSPAGTIPWIVALGLIVVGLALGYWSLPKAKPVAAGVAALDTKVAAPAAPPPPPSPEPPTPSEHAPFGEPDPTAQQPEPPPAPPPSNGSPA